MTVQSVPNPFDPASLRLNPSYAEGNGVKKLITAIPVRKPHRQEFVRVNPDPEYRLDPTAVIELKEEGEFYLLTPAIATQLPAEFTPMALFTAINRQGTLFIWPAKLPSADGRPNEWFRSAMEGAELAMKKWIRLVANMSLGAYEVFQAESNTQPEWPELGFDEILKIAFRDHYVDTIDHPVVKHLRGMA